MCGATRRFRSDGLCPIAGTVLPQCHKACMDAGHWILGIPCLRPALGLSAPCLSYSATRRLTNMTLSPNKATPTTFGNPLDAYSTRIAHEHDLISQRMTWLMTVNGFLLAAYAVVISGSVGQRFPDALTAAVIGISALGSIANASCFFSNYWASRALREATQALHQMSAEGLLPVNYQAYLRLYGSDPRNPPTSFSMWRPPSTILHPWHLLPLVFLVAFVSAPYMFRHLAPTHAISAFVSSIPLILTSVLFSIPIAAEWHWRRSRIT